MAQRSGKITLYEGKHFTGRKLEVFGDCDNFQDRGFMNRVNSIRVESGAWVCFDHPDFRGQQFILEHGDYPDSFRWNSHSDHMGSCRPVGMHGEHFRLEIFEGCNFTGQCLEFLEDCPFLQSGGWAKNCINAIKVYGDGACHTPARTPHGTEEGNKSQGGSCTRSPTTAAACTWWRGATSAASPTGRPTARGCSRSAGWSTSSSRALPPGWPGTALGTGAAPCGPTQTSGPWAIKVLKANRRLLSALLAMGIPALGGARRSRALSQTPRDPLGQRGESSGER
nr:gamma-crystallin N isoform X1 [Macaca nemestrina]